MATAPHVREAQKRVNPDDRSRRGSMLRLSFDSRSTRVRLADGVGESSLKTDKIVDESVGKPVRIEDTLRTDAAAVGSSS